MDKPTRVDGLLPPPSNFDKSFFYDGRLYMPAPVFPRQRKDPAFPRKRKDPAVYLSVKRDRHAAERLAVLTHYCGGIPHCQCPGCRTTFLGFLQLDHIKGDGAKHLAPNGKYRLLGGALHRWLQKNNYPEGFQVLCANCNFAKRQAPACPCSGIDH